MLDKRTSQYNVKIDKFEGPFDLLFHLIEKNKMDIYSIEIVVITDQYLEYIHQCESMDLELASEFLVLASTLLLMKSKMLLPHKTVEDEADEEAMKKELVQKLVEYKKYKEVTVELKARYSENLGTYYRSHEVIKVKPSNIQNKQYPSEVIGNVYQKVLDRNEAKKNKNLKQKMADILARDKITIRSKVKDILKKFISKTRFKFSELFTKGNDTKLDKVTAFMAILELSKSEKVKIEQKKMFGEIVVAKNRKGEIKNGN